MSLLEVLVGVAIVVGIIGVVVPLLPGTALVGGAVLVWAFDVGTARSWTVLALVVAVLALGTVVKYAVPGRRLQNAGIPASTTWAGAGLGVIGFFVVPVVGLFLGFVLGVYLAEHRRVGAAAAWPSSRHALRAVGLSILIELVAVLLAAGLWLAGVAAT
ncbi:DUF456 domain-containing protein [Nocardioides sp. SYSU DS0663]|uniref:DUF456 domain-containing protein n=1 Tax=Nocardioides sp. SYSU DS0663 TaxID=3416445 RepID=UPI003F4BD9C2